MKGIFAFLMIFCTVAVTAQEKPNAVRPKQLPNGFLSCEPWWSEVKDGWTGPELKDGWCVPGPPLPEGWVGDAMCTLGSGYGGFLANGWRVLESTEPCPERGYWEIITDTGFEIWISHTVFCHLTGMKVEESSDGLVYHVVDGCDGTRIRIKPKKVKRRVGFRGVVALEEYGAKGIYFTQLEL